MSDQHDAHQTPGYDSALNNYSAIGKSMQTFAAEMQRMSKETMDATSQLMDRMRSAKSIEDVVSIQTSFMQQSFSNYADFTRRFSEVMMTVPMELARNSRTAFQQGTDAMTRAAEQGVEQVQRAGDQFTQR